MHGQAGSVCGKWSEERLKGWMEARKAGSQPGCLDRYLLHESKTGDGKYDGETLFRLRLPHQILYRLRT
jgi:hypothetical protein